MMNNKKMVNLENKTIEPTGKEIAKTLTKMALIPGGMIHHLMKCYKEDKIRIRNGEDDMNLKFRNKPLSKVATYFSAAITDLIKLAGWVYISKSIYEAFY